MNNKRLLLQLVGLSMLVTLLLAACITSQPASTAVPAPATATAVPAIATATVVPATATATTVPATATATQSPVAMNPPPREVPLAYDAKSDRIIIFGGQTIHWNSDPGFNDETWAYDVTANKWTQMKPAGAPSKRSHYGFAYDAESARVILFGGIVGFNDPLDFGLTDTWAYDYNLNTWKELAKGPANHLGARLAYDSESDRIILFGGLNLFGELNENTWRYVNETWAFDFNANTWTEMKPKISPPGRNFQGMTYDSKADRVLIWGGMDEKGQKPVDESMWAYDFNTNTWQEMKPGNGAHPAGRENNQIVYNAKADRTIMYGGWGETASGNETWAYDYNTNTWTNLDPVANPGNRFSSGLVYSPAADRVILFGGLTSMQADIFSNQTWIYDFKTNTWTNVTPKP